ncbi:MULTISPECIES: PrsW family intramembrane metalloprotease [Amycolatopsis]|uniref:PrsW family intramembrane metalloprotease n=1 Tax=Amycolatopsis TaxID=1813 RepID=UPI0033BE2BB9
MRTRTATWKVSWRWAWVLVLVVGLGLFELVRRVLLDTENPNLVPSLILLGAVVGPATFVTFVWGRRLSFGVDPVLVGLVAIVGGVVGVVTAGALEYDVLKDLGPFQMAGVGVIEETAKLIAPAVVLVVVRDRRAATGLLLGVASGAGFAALETMGYALVAFLKSQGEISAVDQTLLIRGVLSPATHMAWTGLTAAALWAAVRHRGRSRWMGRFAVTFVVAVALHAAWDGIGTTLSYVVLAALSLGLLALAVHRIGHHRSPYGRRVRAAR